MNTSKAFFLLAVQLGFFCANCTTIQADDGTDFFEKKIRPILIKHCYECHGEDEQESDLRLDSYAEMLRGGATAPAIVPGEPNESLLLHTIGYEDDELQMPPDGKLSDAVIADFRKWIEMDAPHPDANKASILPRKGALDLEKERQFWSFQPLVDTAIPTVMGSNWPQQSIDYFILSKLEQQQLSPAAPADRRTLIRRVTFDLTGLPPTPAEIDYFLYDKSPDAYQHLIDRLLDSEAYGERWGRFWLDVVRYADSNGLDENVAHGNAWRYRNYVIAAFNQDRPFNEFLTEQIAGDLMPKTKSTATNNRRVIATGFLVLGPKVLAEVDKVKMEMDIIDEQVSTVGQAFMGMTFGCARCHDHKFDPISTEDYYALAGVFKSTTTMESFKTIAKWNETEIASEQDRANYKKETTLINTKTAELKTFTDAANKELLAALGIEKLPAKPETQYPANTKKQHQLLLDEVKKMTDDHAELPSAMAVTEHEPEDLMVHLRGSHASLGKTVERGFPEVFISANNHQIAAKSSGRLELAQWLTDPQHPLTARVFVNRIWRWHFGQALQPTTDNFGNLGEQPINQPLLDHLAKTFIDNGWSIKDLHRTIMNSSTYRMSSNFNDAASKIDATNRYLWRFPVKRLEAEAIRDSILAVSGLLDRTMGGSMLPVKNREFLFNHTSKDLTKYDSFVRSVYLPVVRNNLYDFFQLFDYNDASVSNGDRQTTTVAPQALYLLNSPLVDEASCQIVEQLLEENKSLKPRVQQLYVKLLGRNATRQEMSRARQYYNLFLKTTVTTNTPSSPTLETNVSAVATDTESDTTSELDTETATAQASAVHQALKLLVHSVLASNEFVFIR
ncbi:MAG: PSD1 and planctomycete cytochrome C domain-containing protein [Pirellulales bacterium]|jgi:cytochrome c553